MRNSASAQVVPNRQTQTPAVEVEKIVPFEKVLLKFLQRDRSAEGDSELMATVVFDMNVDKGVPSKELRREKGVEVVEIKDNLFVLYKRALAS